jgi:hypothetical protein
MKIPPEKKARMMEILSEMKIKLNEIDKWRKKLEKERTKPISAKKAKSMLEEIKVPKLEIIKETEESA